MLYFVYKIIIHIILILLIIIIIIFITIDNKFSNIKIITYHTYTAINNNKIKQFKKKNVELAVC